MKNEYVIWATMKAWVRGAPDSDRPGIREEIRMSIFDSDFISESSSEIKAIIAFYSKLYIAGENEELATALGDFPSLAEAQESLLENREHFFKDIEKKDYVFGTLELEIEDDMVYANLSSLIGTYKGTDVFKIHENGDIEYCKREKQLSNSAIRSLLLRNKRTET